MRRVVASLLLTLALLAGTDSARGQSLKLSGARLTYGMLGPTRPDTKVLPGDSLFLSFDIEGITVDKYGKVNYGTAVEVTDSKGKVLFKQPSRDMSVVLSLGGSSLSAVARVDIGPEVPAGEYTLRATVTDRVGKGSRELTQAFTVLPRAFGLVNLTMSCDAENQVPAGLLGPGQSLWVNAAVIGFGRGSGSSGQPNLQLEMHIRDEAGKPTVAGPAGTGQINKDVLSKAVGLPIQFLVSLNRPGKFTVELKVTDKVAGKTSSLSFPITVLSPK